MKIEEKQILSKEKIIGRLRDVADALEAGAYVFGGHEIVLPEAAELDVEYKSKKGKEKLALEIEWLTPGSVEQSD